MNDVSLSVQRLRPLLGTFVAIEAEGGGDVKSAVAAAFRAVERVGTLMHPTTPGGDVWRISAAPLGIAVRVDPWTFAVLERAREFHRESGGVFDPCRPTRPGRFSDVDLVGPDGVVCGAPVALDLGGIAKGFAVDRAIDELRSHGCTRGVVNAGGDLRWFGSGQHIVDLRRDAGESAQSLRLALTEGALAVSAPRSASTPSEHVGYYSGTTGETVTGQWTAVAAAEAIVADALCKCAMLTEPRVAAAMLERHGARVVQVES